MKTFLLLVFALGCAVEINAQNLVPNPGFEEYTQCPDAQNQVPYATGWESWCSTPDYFNACSAVDFASVPSSLAWGIQYARTGSAYAGLFTYWPHVLLFNNPWLHELIGVQLNDSMTVGQTYYLTMYVSLGSWIWAPCASNNLGVKFTSQSYASYANFFNSPLIDNTAHIHVDSMITDSANWVKITGSYVADSEYNYMVIGNFFDDAHTDTSIIGVSQNCYSYYFIEDVCLSGDSGECLVSATENLNETEEVSLFPNPASDVLHVSPPSPGPHQIKLINNLGQIVYNENFSAASNISVDVSSLPEGIYFITRTTLAGNNKQFCAKVVVQH